MIDPLLYDEEPEHTCSGFYDLSCAACIAIREQLRDDLPGESRWNGGGYEPEEWDVVGGL